MMWAGMRGLLGPGMKVIGVVHDGPDVTSADNIRYDAAVMGTVKYPAQTTTASLRMGLWSDATTVLGRKTSLGYDMRNLRGDKSRAATLATAAAVGRVAAGRSSS